MRTRSKHNLTSTCNRLKTLRHQRRRLLKQLEAYSDRLDDHPAHGSHAAQQSKFMQYAQKLKDVEQDFYNITSEISELKRVMKYSTRKH